MQRRSDCTRKRLHIFCAYESHPSKEQSGSKLFQKQKRAGVTRFSELGGTLYKGQWTDSLSSPLLTAPFRVALCPTCGSDFRKSDAGQRAYKEFTVAQAAVETGSSQTAIDDIELIDVQSRSEQNFFLTYGGQPTIQCLFLVSPSRSCSN